jgi:hypothetical protein
MKATMRVVPLLAWGLVALSCTNHPPADSPEAAWKRFSDALRAGDTKTAWDSLSKDSKAAMAARAKAVSDASRGADPDAGPVIRDDPQAMLFQSGVRPQEAGAAKVVGSTATTATLEVTTGGVTEQVRLVKEGASWQVDLSESLRK